MYSLQKYNYLKELKVYCPFFEQICCTFTVKQKVTMKQILFVFLFVLVSTQSFSQNEPEFQFESETIDYGKITQGANGVRLFSFTNTGKSPLIISKIVASCGCTVPKKPNDPIMPGEKGSIEVSYDTKRVGGFSKAITIFSNAKTARKVITIKGHVEKVSMSKDKNILSEN